MGRFADNVRRKFAGQTPHVTEKDYREKFVDNKNIDAYFIRIKRSWFKFWKEDVFIHFESENTKEAQYRVKPGTIGAAIFTKSSADTFIRETNASNLEAIAFTKIIELPKNG